MVATRPALRTAVAIAVLAPFVLPALFSGCTTDSTQPLASFHASPDTLDFGVVYPGAPQMLDLWICNDTPEDLTLRWSMHSAEFFLAEKTAETTITVPGADSLLAQVICSPAGAGPKGAVIYLEGRTTLFVPCLAQAETCGCEVSPNLVDFGMVPVESGKQLEFTIRNPAPGVLTGRVPDTSRNGPVARFENPFTMEDSGVPFSLEQGESLRVTVLFRPLEYMNYSWTFPLGAGVCDSLTCTGEGIHSYP